MSKTTTIISNDGRCSNLFTESHADRHGPATHRKITSTIHGTMYVDICAKCARDIRSAWDDLIPAGEVTKHALTGADRGRTVYVVMSPDGMEQHDAAWMEIATHRSLRSALIRAIGNDTDAEKRFRWYLIVDRSSSQAQIDRADEQATKARIRLDIAEQRAAGLGDAREVVTS